VNRQVAAIGGGRGLDPLKPLKPLNASVAHST
jgi:hypothetical protein